MSVRKNFLSIALAATSISAGCSTDAPLNKPEESLIPNPPIAFEIACGESDLSTVADPTIFVNELLDVANDETGAIRVKHVKPPTEIITTDGSSQGFINALEQSKTAVDPTVIPDRQAGSAIIYYPGVNAPTIYLAITNHGDVSTGLVRDPNGDSLAIKGTLTVGNYPGFGINPSSARLSIADPGAPNTIAQTKANKGARWISAGNSADVTVKADGSYVEINKHVTTNFQGAGVAILGTDTNTACAAKTGSLAL